MRSHSEAAGIGVLREALGEDDDPAVAPQLTRYHPSVRETLHALTEAELRDPDSLTGFARWTGITL